MSWHLFPPRRSSFSSIIASIHFFSVTRVSSVPSFVRSVHTSSDKPSREIELQNACSSTHQTVLQDLCRTIGKRTYQLRKKDILQHEEGATILQAYDNFDHLLRHNKSWLNELNPNRPRCYWKDTQHQKDFLEQLARQKGLRVPHELEQLSQADIIAGGGRQLLRQYSSLFAMYSSLFPEHEWSLFSFSKIPRGSWDDHENQRAFFDNIIRTRQLNGPLDLADLTTMDIRAMKGGRALLSKYPSYFELLRTLYPQEDWNTVQQRMPRGHWDNVDNIREFIERVSKKFVIESPEDWYRVSYEQLAAAGGERLLRRYGGLGHILRQVYPDVAWNWQELRKRDKRSSQRFLFIQLARLFPDYEIIEDYSYKDVARVSGQSVELDIFIPHFRLAFEYHGIHHYKDTAAFGPIEMYQERDREKERLCREFGIDLVVIPYTWDNEIDSLKQQIPLRYLSDKE